MEHIVSIPIFTRIYLIVTITISLLRIVLKLTNLKYILTSLKYLKLTKEGVIYKFQFWRIFSNIFITRHLSYTFIIHLILIVRYFSSLETYFKNKKGNKTFYSFLLSILILNAIIGLYLENEVLSNEFEMVIIFIESMINNERIVSIYGIHLKCN